MNDSTSPRPVEGPDTGALYRRLIRRETHSPRSFLAIVLAVLLILTAVWVGTELVIGLLGLPALLVAPVDALGAVGTVPDIVPGALAAAGVAVALVGLLLVIAALTSGRRPRHVLGTERMVTVVDNEVIASALARRASLTGGIAADDTRVDVAHRRADVHLVPVSGRPIDRERVERAVSEELDGFALQPSVRSNVVIAKKGRVGA